ncbi:MAG: glycoside hydrolase family 13 protein [Coriobacteriales bacterium]|nr:glycoside hydrolase family 13 protein [Coriobacteriales bacterium]
MNPKQALLYEVIHNPADTRDREPLGAIPAGSSVKLSLRVQREAAQFISSVCLVTVDWIHNSAPESFPMQVIWDKQIDLQDRPQDEWVSFVAQFSTKTEPSVYLYLFELKFFNGEQTVYGPQIQSYIFESRDDLCRYPSDPAEWFRITSYDRSFSTPAWTHGAVMYQVFPDRFARSQDGVLTEGLACREALGRKTYVHSVWDEPVKWYPHTYGFLREDEQSRREICDEDLDPVDFYGGTLKGIEQNLSYLAGLGVEVLYMNPVFEARSNHRYDTANYEDIDPLLGSNEDFCSLAQAAERYGIRIVLDAVLSHTGADSRYFNRVNTYDEPGAWQAFKDGSLTGAYSQWFDFEHHKGLVPYRCWWGDPALPEVDEENSSWQTYMLDAQQGVLPTWLSRGTSGYRLDVADELPDDVLKKLRHSVKKASPDACIIGEVWEDPTVKISYDTRRTYALGDALDSVMNYPLRDVLIDFACNKADAYDVVSLLLNQLLNYPKPFYLSLMNMLGSHDSERIRSRLALQSDIKSQSRANQFLAVKSITQKQDAYAAQLQSLLVAMIWTLPGMPCIYYGDELGLQGGADPFCRATMPWQNTEQSRSSAQQSLRSDCGVSLETLYRDLGALRKNSPVLKNGSAGFLACGSQIVCIVRVDAECHTALVCLANRSTEQQNLVIDLASSGTGLTDGERAYLKECEHITVLMNTANPHSPYEPSILLNGLLQTTLPPTSACIYKLM